MVNFGDLEDYFEQINLNCMGNMWLLIIGLKGIFVNFNFCT